MNFPDHFLWIDRAAVISAWAEAIGISLAVVLLVIIVVALLFGKESTK